MKARVIAIGNEILEGSIVDTNSSFIARDLSSLGIEPIQFESCGDDLYSISRALRHGKADAVFITGGLGPTDDDITRKALSIALGLSFERSETAVNDMMELLKRRGRRITKRNLTQCMIPKGAKIMRNKVGTAPGFIIEKDGTAYYVFPGVPYELKEMFEGQALPDIKKRFVSLSSLRSVTFKMFGLPESRMNDMVNRVKKPQGVSLGFYPSFPEVKLKISYALKGRGCSREVAGYVSEIKRKFTRWIFAENEERIEEKLVDALIKNKLTLSIAESVTGGLLASSIVSVSGSSKCFDRGFVTYSNRSKIEDLGVKGETIKRFGAVSRQCAIEMAQAVRRVSKTDIGVSTTGIAGPTGATKDKPLGTTYIGISARGLDLTEHFIFRLERNRNRLLAMYEVFMRLLDLINKKKSPDRRKIR